MDSVEIIKSYYDEDVLIEWERLEKHYFEFEITSSFMDKYMKAGDSVLDVGGGPGRYSLYLASKGCDVTLVDLSPKHVEFAKEKAIEKDLNITALAGDARHIDTLVSQQYDHILLMGPLYHLLDKEDRIKTVDGCLKLLKPGGLLYVSFISSYAGIIYAMKNEPDCILVPELKEDFELYKEDKEFNGKAFTEAYFIRHKDILPFMSQFPLKKLHLFGQESILAPCELTIMEQPKEVVDKWIELGKAVSEREDLFSYSEHLMYIGKKY